ncbi:hypothetical protein HDU67_005025 [Dinochytrium kinnereticum]|nr:hypothetical protein HDU67_005025 [Dinochytrium kinnereticum]
MPYGGAGRRGGYGAGAVRRGRRRGGGGDDEEENFLPLIGMALKFAAKPLYVLAAG